jgi:hypothetical protein
MSIRFYQHPQTCFWHEVRERLSALQGVRITSAVDDPVIGSWIDFSFRGHDFMIHAEAGTFIFSAVGRNPPDDLCAEIQSHFETLLGKSTDNGDGGAMGLMRR